MMKRALILIASVLLLLLLWSSLSIPMVFAIGETTPTPPPFREQFGVQEPTQNFNPIPTPFGIAVTPIPPDFGTDAEIVRIANDLYFSGRTQEALDTINPLLQRSPFNVEALILRARVYLDLGQTAEALVDYEDAYRNRRWDWDLLQEYINVLVSAGDYSSAIFEYDKLIERFPFRVEYYFGRGDTFSRNGQQSFADRDYRFAELVNSSDTFALLSFAQEWAVQDPQMSSYAYMAMGSIYYSQGDSENAIINLDASLQLDPQNIQAYLTRGLVYEQLLGNEIQAGFDFLGYVQNNQIGLIEQDIQFDQPITLPIRYGTSYLLRFSANAGDVLTFNVTNLGDVDPIAIVLDASGTPVTSQDDQPNGNLDVFLQDVSMPFSGLYTFVVSHSGGGSQGDIEVEISTP
jgi:tetratricopeptide (TPR) repeat protein